MSELFGTGCGSNITGAVSMASRGVSERIEALSMPALGEPLLHRKTSSSLRSSARVFHSCRRQTRFRVDCGSATRTEASCPRPVQRWSLCLHEVALHDLEIPSSQRFARAGQHPLSPEHPICGYWALDLCVLGSFPLFQRWHWQCCLAAAAAFPLGKQARPLQLRLLPLPPLRLQRRRQPGQTSPP